MATIDDMTRSIIGGGSLGNNQNPYDYNTQHDQWAKYVDSTTPMAQAYGGGGASGGGTDWGSILNQVLGLGSNAALAFGGGSTGAIGQAREAAAMADPFAGQRGQYQNQLAGSLGAGGQPNPYQTQLNQLLTDPNSFKTDPGYQFALGQGQQAVERGSNALYGTGRTGSLGPELAKYTEGYANQAFDNRINQLAGLSGQQQTYNTNQIGQLLTASGANQGNPMGAGQMLMGGFQGQQNALGNMLYGMQNPYGGSGGTTGGVGQLLNTLLRGGSGGGGSDIPSNFGGSSTDPWYDASGMNPNADLSYNFGDWGGSVADPWYG